jgi:hypothetical protein
VTPCPYCGTDGSNLAPSSGASAANQQTRFGPTSITPLRPAGPTCAIHDLSATGWVLVVHIHDGGDELPVLPHSSRGSNASRSADIAESVVISAGIPFGIPGATTALHIARLSEQGRWSNHAAQERCMKEGLPTPVVGHPSAM